MPSEPAEGIYIGAMPPTLDVALLLGTEPLGQACGQTTLARPDILAEGLHIRSACAYMKAPMPQNGPERSRGPLQLAVISNLKERHLHFHWLG